jgi:hypothetical protein
VERAELRLVREPAERRRGVAPALGATIVAVAALATALGADDARRPFAPAELAETALVKTLSGDDPRAVDRAIGRLRSRLVDVPLDAASRTTLANLMVEIAGDDAGRAAAASQATTATRLSASDEWVARASARVLARCGRGDEALAAIAAVFAYAPDPAALTLSEIEPFVAPDRLAKGLPDTPAAWLAWSTRLRGMGRDAEADARLAALLARWPDDLRALVVAAGAASGADRIDELARLLPPSRALPRRREAAPLYAFRARVRGASHDAAGAREDIAQATALASDDPWVHIACGDALAPFDAPAARAHWTRALYTLEASGAEATTLVWVRYRLARLDDREGRGADALRTWRSILVVRPDSEEARRRVEELTGGSLR